MVIKQQRVAKVRLPRGEATDRCRPACHAALPSAAGLAVQNKDTPVPRLCTGGGLIRHGTKRHSFIRQQIPHAARGNLVGQGNALLLCRKAGDEAG